MSLERDLTKEGVIMRPKDKEPDDNVGDDLCDRCMRSNIVVDHTTEERETVCLDCAEDT